MRLYRDADEGFPYNDIFHLLDIKTEGWYTYMSDDMGKVRQKWPRKIEYIELVKAVSKIDFTCSVHITKNSI